MQISKILITSLLFICFFIQSKAQVIDVKKLNDGERLNLKALQNSYSATKRLPNEYYANKDTFFFIYKVLSAEWYKAGIRFHTDGSDLKISCCVKEDGSIDVLTLNFDNRFSEQDVSKMLQIAEYVRTQFKFKPAPSTKFFFGTETIIKNP